MPQRDVSAAKAYWPAVVAISLAMFGLIGSELLPVGLLTPMAQDLDVAIGAAGQAITATAIIAAIASPVIILGAGRFDRRKLVVLLTATIFLSGLLTALAQSYWVLLVARALLGIALGGLWAMLTALALRLVPPTSVPRAMSIIFTGITAATVFAPSAGLFLGELWGWRGTFGAAAAIGLLALIGVIATLPKLPAAEPTRIDSFRIVLTRRSVVLGIVMVMLVLAGHFAGFTYVRPIIEQVAQLSGETIALALLLYGLAGLVGNTLGGALAQQSAAGGAIFAALLIALAALTLVFLGGSPIMAFVSVAAWGLAFGAFPVCITTWTAKAAPDHAESAGALIATSFQVAIAIGASVGGPLFDNNGAFGIVSFTSISLFAGALVMLVGGLPLERGGQLMSSTAAATRAH
jgi:predicted MFS family arabinose efflux permease